MYLIEQSLCWPNNSIPKTSLSLEEPHLLAECIYSSRLEQLFSHAIPHLRMKNKIWNSKIYLVYSTLLKHYYTDYYRQTTPITLLEKLSKDTRHKWSHRPLFNYTGLDHYQSSTCTSWGAWKLSIKGSTNSKFWKG